MDFVHREKQISNTITSRECQFCSRMDPDFPNRNPVDKLIHSRSHETASAHLTEEGHVRHRILEVKERMKKLNVKATAA